MSQSQNVFRTLDALHSAEVFWRYTGMAVEPLSDLTALKEMVKAGYTMEAANLHIEGGRERANVIGYAGPAAWLVKKRRVIFWIPRFKDGHSDWSEDQMEELYRDFTTVHGNE